MKHSKNIFLFFILISIKTFSQSSFSSLDHLFSKTISVINQKDSSKYISILDLKSVFIGKKLYTKIDSITILKPYYEAFSQLIRELIAMDKKNDFDVKYEAYEILGKKEINPKENEKMIVQVKLLVNNTHKVKMIFFISTYLGQYFMEKPMMVGFGF